MTHNMKQHMTHNIQPQDKVTAHNNRSLPSYFEMLGVKYENCNVQMRMKHIVSDYLLWVVMCQRY